jgi:class III poly(R)-hydroxyalkanoic acid synthase PhaE subunit
LQKAQADLMRQWLDMNAAWARATPAAGAAAAAGAAGFAPAGAAGAAPGTGPADGGEIARRFLQQCEQYLGVSRSLWDLMGRAATAADAEQRTRLFQEGLGTLQQQFAGLWAATPFASAMAQAPAMGAMPGMAGLANPFAAFAGFGAMPGAMPGAAGFNPFAAFGQGAGPGGLEALFGMPALGPAREQQQSWQRLAQLATRYGQAHAQVVQQWNDIIGKSLKELGERITPKLKSGAQPGSMKEIYDLWIDSAEGVYAQAARGAGFVQAQAELTNSMSQLRSAQRELVEEWSRQFDLPTRAEINSIHQQLRDLKAALNR